MGKNQLSHTATGLWLRIQLLREVCSITPGMALKEMAFFIIIVLIKSDRTPSTGFWNEGLYHFMEKMCKMHGHWQRKSMLSMYASTIFHTWLYSSLGWRDCWQQVQCYSNVLALSMLLKEHLQAWRQICAWDTFCTVFLTCMHVAQANAKQLHITNPVSMPMILSLSSRH